MFIARWQIDARFGHKQTVIEMMKRWLRDIGRKAGTDLMNVQLLTGSIGPREATVEVHHTVDNLSQLEAFFAAIGQDEEYQQWGRDLEAFVVSGSSKWSIYRVV